MPNSLLSAHFLLFVDELGNVLVFKEQGLLKLPKRMQCPPLDTLNETAPGTLIDGEIDQYPMLKFTATYHAEIHKIEVFRVPTKRNPNGIWIDLRNPDKRVTNCILDEVINRLHPKTKAA